MKSTAFVSACLLWMLIACSCGKTTCIDPGLRITFKGYDSMELGRVLVSKYLPNTGFAAAINITFLDTAYFEVQQSNDTIYTAAVDTAGIYVSPGYDYLIQVPARNKTYTITSISYHELKQNAPKNGNGGCTNDAYYYLDSMPVTVSGQLFSKPAVPPVVVVLNK